MASKDPKQIELEKDIIKLKSEVDVALLEAAEEDFTPELRELRDRVFLAHSNVENYLDFAIFCKLLNCALPGKPEEKAIGRSEFASFFEAFDPIQKGLTFVRKLEILKKTSGIPEDLSSLIRALNQIRVEFAHPKERQYKKYENLDEYKKALSILVNTLQRVREESAKILLKVRA